MQWLCGKGNIESRAGHDGVKGSGNSIDDVMRKSTGCSAISAPKYVFGFLLFALLPRTLQAECDHGQAKDVPSQAEDAPSQVEDAPDQTKDAPGQASCGRQKV